LASITFKPENTTGPHSWHKNQQMASIILNLENITCTLSPLTYALSLLLTQNICKLICSQQSSENYPPCFFQHKLPSHIFSAFVFANPTQVFPSLFMRLKKKHLGRAP
jgi:hypothetical protein